MEINLSAAVQNRPVHIVKGPPALKGNQFFIVDSWHIDGNQLRFEFKMCEVPGVDSQVSTACGRAYRWAKLEQQDE